MISRSRSSHEIDELTLFDLEVNVGQHRIVVLENAGLIDANYRIGGEHDEWISCFLFCDPQGIFRDRCP